MIGVDCLEGSKFKSVTSLWVGVTSYSSAKKRMLDIDIGLSMTLLSIPKSCSRFGRGVRILFASSCKHDKSVVKEE